MPKKKILRLRVYLERNPTVKGILSNTTIDVPFDMEIKDLLKQIGARALTRSAKGRAEYGWEKKELKEGPLEADREYLLHSPPDNQFEEYQRKFEEYQRKYSVDRQVIPGTNFILPEGCNLDDATSKLVEMLHE